MKNIRFIFSLCVLLLIGSSSEIFSARYGGGSSFRSSGSSFRSTSSGSSFRSSTPKPASAPRMTTSPSTFKSTPAVAPKPTSSVSVKPKAVSTSKIDTKKSKVMASQNKQSAQKYGTKANAEKAYREKLISSNKYNSPNPPTTRPANIPSNVTVNNVSVGTTYGMLPGGGYGYGYYDPVSHMFMALAMNQMLVNDAMMMESGSGHWDSTGRPIVVHNNSGLMIFFIILGSIVVILVVVAFVRGF